MAPETQKPSSRVFSTFLVPHTSDQICPGDGSVPNAGESPPGFPTAPNKNNWGTDPNLPLGRLVNTWDNGPVIQGVSSNVFFGQNFVSTWPAAGFYMAEPATTNNSTFRILWPIADNTYYDTRYCERYRAPPRRR